MEGKMQNKENLPVYGVGPIYGVAIVIMTIVGIVLSKLGLINCGKLSVAKIPFVVIGALILTYGFSVWYRGAFKIEK